MAKTAPVLLSVPAEPAYARSVRMLAANLGVLAGLSVDDVEDARMAAEEAFVWCCATKPETFEATFNIYEGSLDMEFLFGDEQLSEDDQTSTYAELIISAVCDECVVDRTEGTLHLKKSASALDA